MPCGLNVGTKEEGGGRGHVCSGLGQCATGRSHSLREQPQAVRSKDGEMRCIWDVKDFWNWEKSAVVSIHPPLLHTYVTISNITLICVLDIL